MSKIWYGNVQNNEGYVYKRFVSMTLSQATQALKIIRENKGYSIDENNEIYRNAPIKREGNYLFLNSTQATILGVERYGYNTAIHIKE